MSTPSLWGWAGRMRRRQETHTRYGAMTPDDNKAAVRRFFDEAYNGRNPRFFQEAYAEGANPDAAAHGGLPGAAGAERYLEMFLTAFPDLRVEILDLVAEFDVVCCRYVGRGTHTGPLMHRPPRMMPVRETRAVFSLRAPPGRNARNRYSTASPAGSWRGLRRCAAPPPECP